MNIVVAGYKINTQKFLAFLYTTNEKTEKEIKETIPFTTATKRIKYLGIYLPKETKDLYIQNFKHWWKKSKGKVSEVTQSCPTLCDPMDCSLPGSSVHGIFQAIVLEWIAISFSSGSSRPRDGTQVSCIVDRRFTIWATREVHKRNQRGHK